ncbi:MAG: RDD family protein [Acidobacteria bacterium]|nr:RDD family protein [Acidobacteriota bacterium]
MLDTQRALSTPEGVAITLRVAGPPVRALAWTVDVVLRFGTYIVISLILSAFSKLGVGLYFLLAFVGEWFYPVAFEVYMAGATPGKRLLGIQVLHDDGTPVGLPASLIRNLLRFADFLPLTYAFGLVSMMIHKDFKRLGDLAAGTVVVYRYEEPPLTRVEKTEPASPGVALTLEEQGAILEFAERLPTWTRERGLELASLLRPLTQATGTEGRQRLLALANWLVGRR